METKPNTTQKVIIRHGSGAVQVRTDLFGSCDILKSTSAVVTLFNILANAFVVGFVLCVQYWSKITYRTHNLFIITYHAHTTQVCACNVFVTLRFTQGNDIRCEYGICEHISNIDIIYNANKWLHTRISPDPFRITTFYVALGTWDFLRSKKFRKLTRNTQLWSVKWVSWNTWMNLSAFRWN